MLFTEQLKQFSKHSSKQPHSTTQVNGNLTANLNVGQPKCIGILLAGGLSSRMGTNKSQLIRRSNSYESSGNELSSNKHASESRSSQAQSMLTFSAKLLCDAGVDQLIISANASQVAQLTNDISQLSIRQPTVGQAGTSQGGMFQPKIVTDLTPNLGPLGGIYSVLEQVPCQAALILPVDLPLMTSTALHTLKQTGEIKQQATLYHRHMLPLYLPNNAYTELFFKQHFSAFAASALQSTPNPSDTAANARQKNQGASIKTLLSQLPHQSIDCTAPNLLMNTNTPEDWQQAQSQLLSPSRSF